MSFMLVLQQGEYGVMRSAELRTDISPNNILQNVEDDSVLSRIEQGEIERPVARKTLKDRTIYNSRPMPLNRGLPILCDLGQARIGNRKHRGDIMPDIQRAPEVILGTHWDTKVDIWAIGVMVSPYSLEIAGGVSCLFANAQVDV